MRITPSILAEFGEALYGVAWHGDMCRALDVSERTLRRWMVGTASIPEGVYSDLIALCRERARKLMEISGAAL